MAPETVSAAVGADETPEDKPVKKKRGRPPGSTNKKATPKADSKTTPPATKKRGRPKGSGKSKKIMTKKSASTSKSAAASTKTIAAAKRKPGRPKGSTNTTSAASKSTTKTRKTKNGQTIIETSIKNDRCVELRGYQKLNATTVVQLQHGLLLQHMAKGDEDKSSLKFYMGPCDANQYTLQDQAALADVMRLVNRPVDMIVRSALDSDGLKGFLSTNGKRFMFAGAYLHLGPIAHSSPYGKNKSSQVRRRLMNDYVRDLMGLIAKVSGETDWVKIYRDINSAKGYSALESLFYGDHGLIDGILIGHDRIITRRELDKYLQEQNWDVSEIKLFLKEYLNVYKLPTRPLKSVAPESIPNGTLSYYKPIAAEESKPKKRGRPSKKEKYPQTFYHGDKKLSRLPLTIRPNKDTPFPRLFVNRPSTVANGILDDDVIFFQSGFKDETARQIGDALLALEHKKLSTGSSTHIKLLENSPGGSVWSGQELRSLIRSLKTPVDIIVQGMGASCGSWLLCSATGHRFATPNARIMIHEAATQVGKGTPHNHLNEMMDDLDQATIDYISIVADSTGRSFDDVLTDFNYDVWFNPVEALFYGEKGFIDGILVSPEHVITKGDVEKHLRTHFGSKKALEDYVAQKLDDKRDPRRMMSWRPEEHDPTDPFANPLAIIDAVANYKKAQSFNSQGFKGVAPNPKQKGRTIDYFTVIEQDK